MRISIRSRWTRMAVPVRVPSVAGSAWNDGTQMIVKFGAKPRSWSAVGSAEQVAREDARPGGLGVDPQRAAMGRGGADEAVLAVEVPRRGVGDQAGAQAVVVGLGDRPVDGAPPDLVAARRLVDDELVLGRAAGVLAGPDDERTVGRDEALAVADGVLVQLGGRAGWRGRSGPRAGRAGRGGGGHRRWTPGAQAITSDRPAARDACPRGPQESASAVVRWADATTLRNGCGPPQRYRNLRPSDRPSRAARRARRSGVSSASDPS